MEATLHEGPLRKRGGRGKFNERYFILRPGGRLLYYYSRPTFVEPPPAVQLAALGGGGIPASGNGGPAPRRVFTLGPHSEVSDAVSFDEKRGLYVFRVRFNSADPAATASSDLAPLTGDGYGSDGYGSDGGGYGSGEEGVGHTRGRSSSASAASSGRKSLRRTSSEPSRADEKARQREFRYRAAKIGAITTGGIVVGVLTVGVGLLAGAIVAGGAAAAGGGVVAYQASHKHDGSVLVLASEIRRDAEKWRSMLAKQVVLASQAEVIAQRRPSTAAHDAAASTSSSTPTAGAASTTAAVHDEEMAPEAAAELAAAAAQLMTGRWACGALAAWQPLDFGGDDHCSPLGACHQDFLVALPGYRRPPRVFLPKPATSRTMQSQQLSSRSPLQFPGVSACPPLPPCCFPCRRVRAVLRASPLDTFVSVMSGSKLMEAHGVASEMRFVEAVDDHTVTTGWVAHKNVMICG